jgi:perosamine synthetase
MGKIKLPAKAIDFFKSNIDEIFSSGNLAEGKWNATLSEFVKDYCTTKYAIPTCSNGSGLVALMNIYRNYFNRKHVIIQSNTMYGVKTMVYAAGNEVVGYIDCNIKTLMPSYEQVEIAVEKYKGDKESLMILLSHIGGIINPDMEKIAEFCKSEKIILLEDCAHSFGATLKGKHSGTFGDGGVFSFYATKSIPAGEGGIVITNQKDVGDLVQKYVIYDRFEQKIKLGVNIRPSEIQALLTYSVVKNTKEIINNKKEIADRYMKACNDLFIQYIKQANNNSKGNWYKFIIYNEEKPIAEYLPCLKTKTSGVYDYALGNSTEITNHHVCLPIWYGQEMEITDKVVSELYESKKN